MVDRSEGPRQGDHDEVALAELVARYVGPPPPDPGRQPCPLPGADRQVPVVSARTAALHRLALGTAIAVQAEGRWTRWLRCARGRRASRSPRPVGR